VANFSFRNLFAFLFTRGQKQKLMAEYVIREHRRGRDLAEILEDPYVVNNCSPDEIRRILDEPEVLHAIGDDLIAAHKSQI
jgi:hypothetical protein